MTGNTIFKDFSAQQTADFRRGLMVARHSLPEMEMFSDAALAQLIENHPDALSMVYAMPTDAVGYKRFREGDLRGVRGGDVIEAIRNGQLWVQLLRLNKANPAFAALEKQIVAELKQHVPGLKLFGCRLSLLISSPSIHVSYHADIPRNALWQIRGGKKVYVYPVAEKFISEEALEGVYLGETQEAIHYEPEFDAHATVVDLRPGMVVTWPINGPHRIVNDDELSVSMVMEYFEPIAWFRYAVYYTNGVMRRRFGRPARSTRTRGPVMWAKAVSSVVFKLLGVRKQHRHKRYLTFRIDPGSRTGYSEIPKVIRDF
jgi:hypothetical protein